MIKLLSEKENDKNEFILNSEKIVGHAIELWNPKEIYVTRIDNWFDQKWMNFSGTMLSAISIWKGETTIPPFHPNRVELTDYYEKTVEKVYVQKKSPIELHPYQESNKNLKRYISNFLNDGLLIWYSGNSKVNGLGSIMIYSIRESECRPFFVTLSENNNWKVSKTKGISRDEIEKTLN